MPPGKKTAKVAVRGTEARPSEPSPKVSHKARGGRLEDPRLVHFGAKVLEVRKRLGLSQKQLAERAGINSLSVLMLESGRQNMTITKLLLVTDALEMDIGQFFPQAPVISDERAQEIARAGTHLGDRMRTQAKRLAAHAEVNDALIEQLAALMKELSSSKKD